MTLYVSAGVMPPSIWSFSIKVAPTEYVRDRRFHKRRLVLGTLLLVTRIYERHKIAPHLQRQILDYGSKLKDSALASDPI